MNTAMTKRQYSRRTGRNRMRANTDPHIDRIAKYAAQHPKAMISQMAVSIKLRSKVIADVIISNHARFAYTVDASHPDECSYWTVEVRQ